MYANGLRGLVQLTSASIELFRKMAEVSLLPQVPSPCSSCVLILCSVYTLIFLPLITRLQRLMYWDRPRNSTGIFVQYSTCYAPHLTCLSHFVGCRLTVLVSSELDALASVHAEVLTDLVCLQHIFISCVFYEYETVFRVWRMLIPPLLLSIWRCVCMCRCVFACCVVCGGKPWGFPY